MFAITMLLRVAKGCSGAFLAAALVACSNGNDAGNAVAHRDTAQVFGSEDKAAARALSVGSDSMAQTDLEPYGQALLCREAVRSMVDTLRESGRLSAEQMTGMEQLVAFYDRQILSLSSGKSQAEIRSDAERYSAKVETDAARTAFACVRKLQLDS